MIGPEQLKSDANLLRKQAFEKDRQAKMVARVIRRVDLKVRYAERQRRRVEAQRRIAASI